MSSGERARAVIFDMDGVLVDSEPLWAEAERAFIDSHGGTYDDAFFRDTMGWGMREFMTRVRERYGLSDSLDDLCADLTKRLLALFPTRLEALDGADDLLRTTAARFPSAIASGSPISVVEAVIDQFDWRSLFRAICSADMVAKGKPAPELFLYAASQLGVSPSDCTVIEDSPAGVEAAHRAGMRCVAVLSHARVTESMVTPSADRIVHSLREIDDAVLWG